MTRSLHTILGMLVEEAVEVGLDLPLSPVDQQRLVTVMAAIGDERGVRCDMPDIEDRWQWR